MKNNVKKLMSVLLAVVMLLSIFGMGSVYAEDTSVTSRPHLLAKAGSALVNFTINTDVSYFQHELPEIPAGNTVTSATWYMLKSTFAGNYQSGVLSFCKFNSATKLTASFNASDVTGYSAMTETTPFATVSQIANSVENGTFNGTTTGDYVAVDFTDAVASAYLNGDTLFGYAAKLTDGYCTVSNYAQTNRPVLIITYAPSGSGPEIPPVISTPPTVSFTNDADGVVEADENTEFSLIAEVTEGDETVTEVALQLTDSDSNPVTPLPNATIAGNIYTWSFSSGLTAGEYTATVRVTDDGSLSATDTITITISETITPPSPPTGPVTVYIPANMMVSNGATNNFQILNGSLSYLQYDLASYIEANSVVTDAKWYFGRGVDIFSNQNGSLMLKEITNQTAFSDKWTATNPAGLTVASSYFLTSDAVSSLTGYTTKMANGCASDSVINREGYFVTVPMTDAVAASWEAGNSYFGFGVMLNEGGPIILGHWADAVSYWPMLEVTYESLGAPAIVDITTGTNGSIVIYDGDSVTIESEITQGANAIVDVALTVKDKNGNSAETVGDCQISGNHYSWNISNLTSGKYTATVSVTDSKDQVSADELIINVLGTESFTTKTVNTTSKTGGSYQNLAWSSEKNWQANDNGLIAYFAYDLSQYANGNINPTEGVIWSANDSLFDETVTIYEIQGQWDNASVAAGVMPKVSATPIVSGANANRVDFTSYVVSLFEKGITTLQFAVVADSGTLTMTKSNPPILTVSASNNTRPIISADVFGSYSAGDSVTIDISDDDILSSVTAKLGGTGCLVTDNGDGSYTATIPSSQAPGTYAFTVTAEDYYGAITEKSYIISIGGLSHHITFDTTETDAALSVTNTQTGTTYILVAYQNQKMVGIQVVTVGESETTANLSLTCAGATEFKYFVCDSSFRVLH